MGYNGKRYDEEFKADAMRLVRKGGSSVPSVAKDLGINPQTLRNWLGEDNKRQNPDKVLIVNRIDPPCANKFDPPSRAKIINNIPY